METAQYVRHTVAKSIALHFFGSGINGNLTVPVISLAGRPTLHFFGSGINGNQDSYPCFCQRVHSLHFFGSGINGNRETKSFARFVLELCTSLEVELMETI